MNNLLTPKGKCRNSVLFLAFLLLSCLGVSSLSAQNLKESGITLKVQNENVEKVFNQITNLTNFKFFYDQEIVNSAPRVSLDINKGTLKEILSEITAQTKLFFNRTNNTIAVSANPKGNAGETKKMKTLSGVVVDENGEPVIGATIMEQGTSNGAITNVNGEYTLMNVSNDATILVSYIGYKAMSFRAMDKDLAKVVLKEDSQALDEVVVTALGISRKEKNLSYATQSVSGGELQQVRDLNVVNSLSGKVAGLEISKVSSGLGGSSKISLRGNRSISGNNQALIVVDGVPIDNTSSTTRSQGSDGKALTGGFDSGDGISSINPSDIESVNVLKGASAAALYGSRASNGVIIITTKKGSTGQGLGVTYSSSFSVDAPNIMLDLQNEYAQGSGGQYNKNTLYNFGPRMQGQMVEHWSNNPNYAGNKEYALTAQPDNVKDFFNTGMNWSNSVGVSTGNEKTQTRFSLNHDYATGIVPNNRLNRASASLRLNSKLSNRVEVDAKINYMNQKIKGKPWTGENIFNPVRQIYSMPRNIVLNDAKTFEYTDPSSLKNLQHFWLPGGADLSQNPYWVVNRNARTDERNKILAMGSMKWTIIDGLSLMLRSSVDYYHDSGEFKLYNDTYQRAPNGDYILDSYDSFEWNNDFLLTYAKAVNDDWNFDVNFGGSTFYQNRKGSSYSNTELLAENLFSQSNAKNLTGSNSLYRRKLNSLYAFAQITYKGFLTLDVTGRNDWSSTLPKSSFSYFYPSVGLSAVLSDIIQMPSWFNFAKVRASYAQVGNDTDPFIINQTYTYTSGGNNGYVYQSNQLPAVDLKPEKTGSLEVGVDVRFFGDRLGLDFAYYNSNTTNQLISIPMPLPSGYATRFINAGKVQNKGVEIKLYGTPVEIKDFSWTTQFNFSKNDNKIKELTDDVKVITLGSEDFIANVVAEEGGSFGDIYVRGFERNENGDILIGSNGLPKLTSKKTVKVGNSTPDWSGGWSNTFRYKNLSLNVLIDTKQGGKIVSFTDAVLTGYGLTAKTLAGREGGIVVPGVLDNGERNTKEINSEALWTALGGRNNPVGEVFVYDASFIRLKEISLSYSFPKSVLGKLPISGLSVGVYGKNLCFLQNKAGIFDPEMTVGTGNNQALEAFSLPSTRTFGLNLNVSF
jgi:TonB-linked SusC/RagA family outer membrane protein